MNAPPRPGRILRSSPWRRLTPALVLGVLALLGGLALLMDAAGYRATRGFASRFAGVETVVVWSHGLESADAAQARAAEILAGVPGVGTVTPLDPATGDALIAHILGAPAASEPRLLAVDTAGGGKSSARRLQQVLGAQDVPGLAVDHNWKDSSTARKAGLIVTVSVLAPLIAILGFALVCAGEARREMAKGHGVIDLMRTSGATEGYVAGLVGARVAGLAFTAALWGAAGAMVAAALVSRRGFVDALGGLSRGDLISPWPLVIVVVWLVGAFAAWLSALSRLKRRT